MSNKQFENWPYSLSEVKNDNDDIVLVSKSEMKRDAQALKDLGSELIGLGKNALSSIPLSEDLLVAIELAQKLKREGRRRQVQLIGKMLRTYDITTIQTALDKLKNRHNQQISLLHKLEILRDKLIAEGDAAISEVLTLYPSADRQQLRMLVRHAQKEKASLASPKAPRLIFQYLRKLT